MEFNTLAFEAAHGKLPRGTGHWAFCPAQHYRRDNYLEFTKFFPGTYAEAKKAAKAAFKGEDELVVCS